MSRTILIVDDHAINREFLSTLLGYSGFRTVEASNGRAALEIARNEGPALIISDVLMPMMDGIELANLLHADPQTSQIPIIFYTATYRLTEARALAQTCGVPFVLSKPAEPTLILGTVAKALNIEIAVPDSHQAAPVNAFLSDASSASALPELAKIQRRLRQAFQPGDAEDPCGLEVTPIPIQPDAQTLSLKLAALLELSLVLTSEYDAAQLLRLFCRAAQDIMNAKCAAIGMWRGDQSIQFASHGMDADEEHLIAGAFQKVGLGLTGNFQSRRTLHCENFKLENNADPHSSIPLSRQDCLMIPIMLGQQMCGWLYLGDKLGTGVFNEDDEQFGLTLVAQLAPVYENLALYDEVREYAGRLELEGIERQRAMVQLQESKELFQQLAENIREVFFLADPHNGHVFYVSPAYESIWGRTCGSLYEHPDSWQEAIHPEDAARIHRLKAGQDKGNEYDLSYRILHPDGSVRFIHERGYPISDAGGALVRIAGIAEDISDEMRTQALLVDREAGLRHAQLLARLAHIISRPDGSFESWSDSLPQLIGVSDGGVPSGFRKWLDIVHQADREAFSHACIEAGRSGSRTEVEYRVWRSDGCLIDVHQVMEPLPEFTNPEGRHRWFNTIQDVSEQTIQRKRIARLNRINGVLSAINSAIVRIHDRDMLFREACRIAVKEGAFSMAWLGIIDPATGHGNVVAWAGEGSEFQRNTRLTARPGMVDSSQPASIALREHRPVVCNRIDQDLSLGPLRGELLAGGHRALATLPLTVDDQAVGVIALFADVTDFFDEQEMRLLNELAGDLSFALQFIGNREQLSYQAFYDALTKIPNDRLFRDRLHQLLQANPPGQHVAIILLNLNRFSQLNDALGRHVGDELLKQVAGRLTDSVHELCSVARISGDTFAIATPQLLQGSDSAVILQHQILYAFEKPFSAGGSVVRLSARAGLALCPEDGADVNTLIHRAEIALKKAKSSGRAYLYYAAEMNTAIATRIMLENELRSAILGKQLEMHYQPRVDLMSGQIVGAEALIRWRHPQRGMIPPSIFIPVAEESDLIIEIGNWVIETVYRQQADWLDRQMDIVPVAINLSAVQFRDGHVIGIIKQMIEKHQRMRGLIEFELTESVVMDNPDESARHLNTIKSLGMRLSLDDFGTGYSSLAYLKRFPFDFVKIDRAFIADVTSNPDDAAITTAVIAMAHSLNLRVVAEAVETAGQLQFLRRLRCDEIQGFYFSRPVPAAEFAALLNEGKCLPPVNDVDAGRGTLLIVDDDRFNLSALNRLLRRDGYRILTASSGQEGLELLALNSVQVIISDQRMPGMSGSEFLGIVKDLYPDTIRIILSGYTELNVIVDSVNRGAVFKFLTKPFDESLLREHIREAFRLYRPPASTVH